MRGRVVFASALCALLACKSFDGDPAPAGSSSGAVGDGGGSSSGSSSSGSSSGTSSSSGLLPDGGCGLFQCNGIVCDNFDRDKADVGWEYKGYGPDKDLAIDHEKGSCLGTLKVHVGHQTSDAIGSRTIRKVISPMAGTTLTTVNVELDLQVDATLAEYNNASYRTVLAVLTTDSEWDPNGNYLAIAVESTDDGGTTAGRLVITNGRKAGSDQSLPFLVAGGKLTHLVWTAQTVSGKTTSISVDGAAAIPTGFPGLVESGQPDTPPQQLIFIVGVASTKGSPGVTAYFDNVKVTSE